MFVGLSFVKPSEASAMRCVAYDQFGGCMLYRPDYPPGGHDCTGAPGVGEVNIYTSPNKGGYCVTLQRNLGIWNFTPSNGWYGYYYVKDIWVGSSTVNGFVCYGTNNTGGCASLLTGYNYSYTNPPYAANQPGWQSIDINN